MKVICLLCNRSFPSDSALQQHERDSPAHRKSFDCDNCKKSFCSEKALAQHVRDSPAHAVSFNCDECDRSFNSEQALAQHVRDSPMHIRSFDCDHCSRSFKSEEALTQHQRDSPAHSQAPAPETPLDIFFRSFPTFAYDPTLPPATSYSYLQTHNGWRRGDAASSAAWSRYQDALEDELRLWYGEEDNLAAWHALCHAIGVEPLPETCGQCEGAVRRTHVNIVDLIEWGRSRGSVEDRVQTFSDVAGLRAYTKRTGKVFRNTLDRASGNVVLRHLLRKLFRGGL